MNLLLCNFFGRCQQHAAGHALLNLFMQNTSNNWRDLPSNGTMSNCAFYIDMKANMLEIYQILIFLHRESSIMLLWLSRANCARTFNRWNSQIEISDTVWTLRGKRAHMKYAVEVEKSKHLHAEQSRRYSNNKSETSMNTFMQLVSKHHIWIQRLPH